MEQAKWYYICFNYDLDPIRLFHYDCFLNHLIMDGLLRTSHSKTDGYMINLNTGGFTIWYWFKAKTFCGKKKLKKLIEEAHLLGLEDELLIFEKRKGETK